MIHPKVVLQGNGGISLGGGFNLYVFFGFNGLVEPIGIPTSLHDPTCLFVNNFYLVVHHHVFHILFEKGIGFQQLIHTVNTFTLDVKIFKKRFFKGCLFLRIQLLRFYFSNFTSNVWKDKKVRIRIVFGKHLNSFFGEVNLIVFFVYNKVQFCIHYVHFSVVVLHVVIFCFLQELFDSFFTQKFDECFVFW